MQVIQLTVLGSRTYLTTATGAAGGVTERQAWKRSLTGAPRGPALRVREFWVKDSETGEKLEATALPTDFLISNRQQATLIFRHFGRKGQRLLAARNNSSGDYYLAPPTRSLALSVLLWLVLGWIGFWVTDLLETVERKPGIVLVVLLLWLAGGTWYLLHERAFQARLRSAVVGGPEQLALMVDR
ncbi:MAG: hypothetical protein WA724_03095 [Candidatus Dormiibacterota bacterium]